MTLVLLEKGLVLKGSTPKIEDKQVPGNVYKFKNSNITSFFFGGGRLIEYLGDFGDGNDILVMEIPGYVWRFFLLSESS